MRRGAQAGGVRPVGQRPFEMGYKAPSVMIDLIGGKKVEDPVFTGLDECTKDTADTCIQK